MRVRPCGSAVLWSTWWVQRWRSGAQLLRSGVLRCGGFASHKGNKATLLLVPELCSTPDWRALRSLPHDPAFTYRFGIATTKLASSAINSLKRASQEICARNCWYGDDHLNRSLPGIRSLHAYGGLIAT
jgi:hypothetical protein